MSGQTLRGFGPPPPDTAELAREALERGQAALAAGAADAAVRWLDRACRLLPDDPLLKLMLATACLASDPARAESLFTELAGAHDVAEVRQGLAAARRRSAMPGGCPPSIHDCRSRGMDGRPSPAMTGAQSPPGTTDSQCSPAMTGVEGVVEAAAGVLSGWAWYPAAPERATVLRVSTADGQTFTVTTKGPVTAGPGTLLARPRAFRLALPGVSGLVHVRGEDDTELLGSPLEPDGRAERRVCRLGTGTRPPRRVPRRGAMAVVIPVHDGGPATLACLESVLAHTPPTVRLVVVDDGSRDPAVTRALDRLATERRITLIRHRVARGFPGAANAGLLTCRGRDVVLLNSDTLVAPRWTERLQAAVHAAPDIGTATPLSNSATILSYPGPAADNPMPDQTETTRLAGLAQQANAPGVVDIPVAVGFCMYLRRDCLAAVGRFRTDLFAQGYGEENELCLRARRLGWRHVAATRVFVAHHGGRSFGAAGRALQRRNQAILERVHPGHDALIAAWVAADPLAESRRRLDLARWGAGRSSAGAAILISHADGGGVERRMLAACAAHRAAGRRAIVLRPAPHGVAVSDPDGACPNLRFALPAEAPALLCLLRADRPAVVEIHHLLGHCPELPALLRRLDVPLEVIVHDSGFVCPRVVLLGPDGRYCGEPGPAGCETCVAAGGSAFDHGAPVAAFRARNLDVLRMAARVSAPSADMARRLHRNYPGIPVTVEPHEPEPPRGPSAAPQEPGRICVIGAIGIAKGFEVLLACARDAGERNLKLDFVVVGTSIDDRALLATGRVFVTGGFHPQEAIALIRAQRAGLAWLPSIVPESWCYALTDAWRAGLEAAAFDLGAPAERIRRRGAGLLLPLGLSAERINAALLAMTRR